MEHKYLPLAQLKRNEGQIEGLPTNPRAWTKAEIEKLKKSIRQTPELLEARGIIVYPHNGEYVILGGNMRYTALSEMKVEQAPCVVLPEGLPLEKLKEIVIKDNGSFGEWDMDLLANEWDELPLTDWGVPAWEATSQEEEATEVVEDDFNEEENDIPARVSRGDVWQLGNHRLMCGDSTSEADVAKLMNGEQADIAFTSPPYNAATTPTELKMGKTTKYNGNEDDKSEDEYTDFIVQYLENSLKFARYSFMNIQSLGNNKVSIIDAMYRLKEVFCDTMIWDKMRSQPAMASNVLNSEFEYIHIFGGNATRAIGTKPFRGTISNILHLAPQSKNEYAKIHNATFSIDFVAYFIEKFAQDSIIDLFGGTGTTMIAAEQLGRKCYMMELNPHYCDIIIARWESHTGKKAEKTNNI